MTSIRFSARHIRRVLQALGLLLIVWLLYSIGLKRLAATLAKASWPALVLVLAVTVLSSLIRVRKLGGLLPSIRDLRTRLDVYLLSRIGREISQLGQFAPLAAPRMRNTETAHGLLVDRYCEVFSTFALALGASLAISARPWVHLLRGVLVLAVGAMLLAPRVPLPRPKGSSRIERWLRHAAALQGQLRGALTMRGEVLPLSLISTALDFVCVRLLFSSLGVAVDLRLVAVIWAASGIAAIVTFTSVGPAEVSSVLLWEFTAAVPPSASVAMIVLSRATLVACLGLLLVAQALGTRRVAPD
jgi:hypothetical protein